MLRREYANTSSNNEEKIKREKQKKALKMSRHLGSGSGLVELIGGDNNGPGLACFAEHLLGLKELTLFENHGPDVLGRCGGGVKDLLHSIDEGDGDLRGLVIGAALDEDLTGGVGFLRLSSIALRQKL